MRFIPNKRLVIVLAILFWVELSLLPLISIRMIKPDLPSVLLAFYAFRINRKRVTLLAFLVGVIQDLFSNSFFGLHTASYMCGALLLQFFALRFDRDKLWIQMTSLFCFSFLSFLVFSILSIVVQQPQGISEWLLIQLFGIGCYTTIVGIVVFPLLDQWLKLVFRSRQYELF